MLSNTTDARPWSDVTPISNARFHLVNENRMRSLRNTDAHIKHLCKFYDEQSENENTVNFLCFFAFSQDLMLK